MGVIEQMGLQPDQLRTQVAVVTGAGHGMGREAALALAALGARVVVADPSEEAGAETLREILAAGGTATCLRTDISRAADVSKLAMWTLADFGPAQILVNTPADVQEATLTCQTLTTGMQIKGRGTVVNFARTPAVAEYSRSLGAEWEPQGIRVITVMA